MKINVGFEKLESILHIADIHIRNYQRHKEYRHVFRKLYKAVSELPENAIIYVGGDIVHNKTDISPELIDLTSEFFRKLADKRHTIVITGNHDTNLNNNSRMDSLSPIIENLNHPQLHYLKDSGCEYNYVCPGYEKTCIWKSRFPGFEFWTGSTWSKDKTLYRKLCEIDSSISNVDDLDEIDYLPLEMSSNKYMEWS